MRLIDADALMELIKDPDSFRYGYVDAEDIQDIPAIDAVPVVRCKDCKFQHTLECPMNYQVDTWDEDDGYDWYMATNASNDDGYCWCGERREEGCG